MLTSKHFEAIVALVEDIRKVQDTFSRMSKDERHLVKHLYRMSFEGPDDNRTYRTGYDFINGMDRATTSIEQTNGEVTPIHSVSRGQSNNG